MKKISLLLVLAIAALSSFSQRNFQLSQYMLHQPFINPASMASYQGLNGALVHRSQWVGFDGAPITQGISVNSPLGKGNNAVGLTIVHDQIGVNRDISISGKYAYKFQVATNQYFSLGLDASLRMLQSNLADATVNDPGDEVFSANTPTFMAPNFSFGMYYFKDRFYIGAALPNILANKIEYNTAYSLTNSFDANQLHYYLHSGYKFILNNSVDLNTSVLLKAVSGAPLQADVNFQFEFNKKFGIGASYRTSKEIIGLVSFSVIKPLKIAYAYDYNMSEIAKFSSGSHEIMLLFDFYQPKVAPIIDVPRF